MNVETGRLVDPRKVLEMSIAQKAKHIPVSLSDLTHKQRQNKQVSLHDTRSKAGKIRRNSYNNLRNKPCVCGSGIKFKKCCWVKMNIARGRL